MNGLPRRVFAQYLYAPLSKHSAETTVDVADVVVAGAGHNSLIAAAYLARAGFEVTVLEARGVIGGNTVTEELTLPGFKHDSCSSAHVLIQSNPLMRNDELGLGDYGLRYVHPDPAVVMPFEDGSGITMWRDRRATAAALGRFSRHDERAYLEMLDEWDGGLSRVHARINNSPPRAEASQEARAAASQEERGAAPDSPEERAYAALAARSASEVVHDRFEHPRVRSFLLWLAFATIQPPDRPGTGILPFAITAGRQEFGWALPVGGSGALPDALAGLVEKQGGHIVTSAYVERVLVEDGRAAGVVTSDGRVFRARRAVLSSIHAARLEQVLPHDALPSEAATRLRSWKPGLTLFAVHLALPRTPRFCLGAERVAGVAGGIGSAPGLLAQLDAFYAHATYDADPWILVVCATVADPDRAPNGGGTMKILTVAPYDLAGSGWDNERDRFAGALVARAAARMDFEPGDVLAMTAEAPPDLEARNPHNLGGSCHGGDLDPAQSGANRPAPGLSGYRLPVPGLYQTGATTHPGGSVSGRPGRNAARVMLADLGVDPATLMSS